MTLKSKQIRKKRIKVKVLSERSKLHRIWRDNPTYAAFKSSSKKLFIIPELIEILPTLENYNPKHDFLYIYTIHYIIDRFYSKKLSLHEQVAINSSTLQSFLDVRYYNEVIDFLLMNHVIFRDYYIIPDKYNNFEGRPYHYSLNPKWADLDVKRKEYTNKTIININKKNFRKIYNYTVKKVGGEQNFEILYKHLANLRIHKELAFDKINKDTTLDRHEYKSRYYAIDGFDDNNGFTIDKTGGRLHSKLTTLPSDLRATCLFLADDPTKKISQLDLSNSQPLFFAIVLSGYLELLKLNRTLPIFYEIYSKDGEYVKKKAKTKTTLFKDFPTYINTFETEFKKYIEWVESGEFYKKFVDNPDMSKQEYTDFKIEFFGKVFYSNFKKQYVTKHEMTFMNEFPLIFNYICELKDVDYKKFPVQLQQVESYYILTDVLSKLFGKLSFFATVHDALLVKEEDVPYVYEIMMDLFKKHNLKPKIKIEELMHYNPKDYKLEELDTSEKQFTTNIPGTKVEYKELINQLTERLKVVTKKQKRNKIKSKINFLKSVRKDGHTLFYTSDDNTFRFETIENTEDNFYVNTNNVIHFSNYYHNMNNRSNLRQAMFDIKFNAIE